VTLAEELYDALGPMTAGDESTGYALRTFCEILCQSAGLEALYDLLRDRDDGTPGWGILFDVDSCPAELLPFLGQFVGVALPPAWDADGQRDAIRNHVGWRRGTPAAMTRAVQEVLTGTKTVVLHERYGGDAYRLAVETLTAETPDPDAVIAAALTQKPIGIQIVPLGIADWTWDAFHDAHGTWGEAEASWSNWHHVLIHPE
jgi:hypothetical protein